MIEVDAENWPRFEELAAYAEFHNLGIKEAIAQLVNRGLSREPVIYL